MTLSVGRIPLFLHNGHWFNNFFDGFWIAKNNIHLGNLSNFNVLYFLTLGETQPGLTLTMPSRRDAEKKVVGVDFNFHWRQYFVEGSWRSVGAREDTMQDIPLMPGPMAPVPLLKLIFALPFRRPNHAKNAHFRQFGSRTFTLLIKR